MTCRDCLNPATPSMTELLKCLPRVGVHDVHLSRVASCHDQVARASEFDVQERAALVVGYLVLEVEHYQSGGDVVEADPLHDVVDSAEISVESSAPAVREVEYIWDPLKN